MWRIGVSWQFLCDSWYDLRHLDYPYGQKDLAGWWSSREYEWQRIWGRY